MTDTSAQTAAPDTTSTDTTQQPTQTFDQAAVDRIVADRVSRERKKYEGFDDLKAKAEKFDKIEEENRSDLEKATSRATELEQELAKVRAESLRLSIAAEHGITGDDLALLTGTDEESLRTQATRLAELLKGKQSPTFAPNPGQGTPTVTSGKPDVASGQALYAERKAKQA